MNKLKTLKEIRRLVKKDQREQRREQKLWKFNNGYWSNYRLSANVDRVKDSYDKTKMCIENIRKLRKKDIKHLIERIEEEWPNRSYTIELNYQYYDNKFKPEHGLIHGADSGVVIYKYVTEQDRKIRKLANRNDLPKYSLPAINVERGNAYVIMGEWQSLARENGWNKSDIDDLLELATSDDYDNLRYVISSVSE